MVHSVTGDHLAELIVEPDDFVADPAAFVDVRLPRSAGKASYSFVGPGVSQNPDQTVNITAPHGFNVGAASMPHGVVNNPHLHFTAEVFVCTRGSWEFAVGEHGDQRLDVGPNSIFSVPTWVFRGFKNTGSDDGWLFAVLGGDDTGGILWAPHVLAEAAATGLHLAPDHSVIDTTQGETVDNAIAPMTEVDLASVDQYSDAELGRRLVDFDRLRWSDQALLSSFGAGPAGAHDCAIAPVIGYGMTEDRSQHPPITNPHGFSIEWLAVEPGSSTGAHRLDDSQVLLLVDGQWRIELNRGEDVVGSCPAPGSVVSVPRGCWRNLANLGSTTGYAVVVNEGDARNLLEWDDNVVKAAADAGWGRDAAGYLAPIHLLGRSGR